MNQAVFEGQAFDHQNYAGEAFTPGRYDDCSFKDCIFNKINLSNIDFIECQFEDCDLSMAVIGHTAFKKVRFQNCKLIGLNFHDCNPFLLSLQFEGCQLDYSSFRGLKMKDTAFIKCLLTEADFTDTDLTKAKFTASNLDRTIFSNTNLEQADFSEAIGFSINPETNRLSKAKFTLTGLPGLLKKYGIIID